MKSPGIGAARQNQSCPNPGGGLKVNGVSLPPSLFPQRTRLGCPKRKVGVGWWYLWPGGALFWRGGDGLPLRFAGYVGTREVLGRLFGGLASASEVARKVEGPA